MFFFNYVGLKTKTNKFPDRNHSRQFIHIDSDLGYVRESEIVFDRSPAHAYHIDFRYATNTKSKHFFYTPIEPLSISKCENTHKQIMVYN